MSYFTPAFNTFFKNLAAHNHKEWMDDHRALYEKEVKEPFKHFVQDVIDAIDTITPLDVAPKDIIFRINNDIRFHKEKPLYKLHVGANFAKGGRKDFNNPAFYVQLSPGESFIASGIYKPDRATLMNLRTGIASDLHTFQKLKTEADFQKHYGTFSSSEKNKLLPKELKAFAEKEPLLYNKQFFFTHEYADGENFVLMPNLKEVVMENYHAALPMNRFLGQWG